MQRDTCGILIKQIHDAVGKHINNALRERPDGRRFGS